MQSDLPACRLNSWYVGIMKLVDIKQVELYTCHNISVLSASTMYFISFCLFSFDLFYFIFAGLSPMSML